MAAIFTLRKGTSNITIADAELYLHQGSGSIQFGSGSNNPITLLPLNAPVNGNIRLTGDITASNAYFSENVTIAGNLYLGNQTSDTITATGEFTSDLIPNPTNTYSIGSNSKIWKNIYATSISGAIAATNGVISGSAQIPVLLPAGVISGSSQVILQSTIGFSAYDSALATITGSLIASASIAKTANDLQDVNIINLNLTTASLNISVSNLNLTTASLNISVSNLNTFSSSQLNKDSDLQTYTSSVNTRLTEIGVVTGSLIVSASTAKTTNDSQDISITNLNAFSGSQLNKDTDLQTYTGSVNTRLTEIGVISGSLIATASNHESRITNVESYTSSLRTALDVTGGNLTVYGNLTVQGTQTTLNTNEVIIEDKTLTLASGSTTPAAADGAGIQIAGANVTMSWDNTNNRVSINTNLAISGSISASTIVGLGGESVVVYSSSVNNRLGYLESASGSWNTRFSTLATYTGSVETILTEIGVISGSLIASASAAKIKNDSQDVSITNLNTFSGSQLNKDSDLATYTGSVNIRLTEIGVVSGSLIASASANTISISNINTFSSSQLTKDSNLASYTGSVNTRLTEIGVVSGSLIASASTANVSIANLNTFSSSQLDKDSTLSTYTGSVNTRLTEIGVVSGSLIVSASTAKITNDAQDVSISNLNNATASLFASASAITASFTALRSEFNTLTASVDPGNVSAQMAVINDRFTTLATLTGSYDTRFTQIGVVTGSLNTSVSNLNTTTASLNVSINNLNSFTASQSTASLVNRLNAIESVSGSWVTESETGSYETRFAAIATYTGSNDTTNTTQNSRLDQLSTISGSIIGRLNNLESTSASLIVDTNNLETFTSSFNTAFGLSGTNVTVKGNLTVQGTTTQIDSTTLNIADNIIQLNGTGATNGGLVVRDATAGTTTSGSLLWDTTNDKWIAGPLGAEDDVVLRTASQTLTNKTISGVSNTLSNISNGSLTNSSITIAGTSTSLGETITLETITGNSGILSGSSQLGGIYETNGRGIVSGSSQIIPLLPVGVISGSSQLTTEFDSRYLNTGADGIVSGSSQIDVTATTNWATGVKTQLNSNTVVSGSSQVYSGVSGDITIASNGVATIAANSVALGTDTTGDYVAYLVAGTNITLSNNSGEGTTPTIGLTNNAITIAGTSVSLGGTITAATILQGTGVISGSSQLGGIYETTGRGIISGSSQLTTEFDSRYLNTGVDGVVSGSAQIDVASTTGDVILGTRTSGNYVATIAGTSNQITVAGSGVETAAITLSLPQNIHTSATPQFSSLGIGTAATGVSGEIRATGDIVAFYSSDERLKENITPIENAIDKINQMGGYNYDWKEGFETIHSHKGHDLGVIAQEVQSVLPEVVTERETGYLAVDYVKLVPVLIQAIKELSAKIKDLENK